MTRRRVQQRMKQRFPDVLVSTVVRFNKNNSSEVNRRWTTKTRISSLQTHKHTQSLHIIQHMNKLFKIRCILYHIQYKTVEFSNLNCSSIPVRHKHHELCWPTEITNWFPTVQNDRQNITNWTILFFEFLRQFGRSNYSPWPNTQKLAATIYNHGSTGSVNRLIKFW